VKRHNFVRLCWCRVDFRYLDGSVMGWVGGMYLSWGGWGRAEMFECGVDGMFELWGDMVTGRS
jgi:hypothetical protein